MQAVDAQSWDPSVKALTQFPSVLGNLAKNLSWTSALGEAYHTQAADVMGAVQFLRAKALVAGNLKFDVRPSPALLARGKRWHDAIGRPVVLAAITREGEEAELMREWGRVQGRNPFLIVVPRHPQRFDEVEALLVQHGLRVARRSSWGEMPPPEALR